MSYVFSPFTGTLDYYESTAIGSAIGGAAGSVLFVDSSGNLAQESANLFYAPSTDTLEIKGSADGVRLVLRAHTANAAYLFETYNTAAALRAKITGAGSFSNSQGRSGSEVFGDGATVNNNNSIAIGNAATVAGLQSINIGQGSSVTETGGAGSINIGVGCVLNGSGNVVIGNSQSVSGTNLATLVGGGNTISKAIGAFGGSNNLSNFGSLAIGNGNTVSHIATFVLGTGMTSSRARELIIGSDGSAGMGGWTGGHRVRVVSTASDSNPYDVGLLDFTWATATAASRKARMTLSVNDATALREGFRIETDGSAPMLGFFGVAAVARPSAYTQTYSTADKTLGAYTADDESAAYTGIDNAQAGTVYAQVADVNALRVAYENLRAFVEDLAAFSNSQVDDLQSLGLVA